MSLLTEYAEWVKTEVLSQKPHERIQNDWKPNWGTTLEAIKGANGLFELFSTLIKLLNTPLSF